MRRFSRFFSFIGLFALAIATFLLLPVPINPELSALLAVVGLMEIARPSIAAQIAYWLRVLARTREPVPRPA